jgi:hypothetical protein
MFRNLFTVFTRVDPNDDGFSSQHTPGTLRHTIDWIRGQLREIEKLTSVLSVSLILTLITYAVAVVFAIAPGLPSS